MTIYRISLLWSLLDGTEQAINTLHAQADANLESTIAGNVAGAAGTAWPAVQANWPSSTKLLGVRVSSISDVAPYATLTTVEVPLSLAGTSTSNAMPPQLAVVATIRTPNAGRRHRGRIYLPTVTQGAMTTSARVGLDRCLALATFVRDVMQPVADLSPGHWGVFSRVDGIVRAASRVEVGDVLDTQRRRRSELQEKREGVVVTGA